jgi:IclR family acetate operon transcriptional repressor
MPVKPSQSASRVLTVLEALAEHQPMGVSDLARLLDEDISAVQRALTTLAHEGWICAAPGKPTRWELTARIHAIAHHAHASNDLHRRARPVLEGLRDATGESATLNVLDRNDFVVMDAAESRQALRVVLTVGTLTPKLHSATARAILPFVSRERQVEILGGEPDEMELAAFAETLTRGYSISSGIVVAGFTNIAAPIFEADGRPVGAILISGPSDRLPPSEYDRLGGLVRAAAVRLSRGQQTAAQLDRSRLALEQASPKSVRRKQAR